MELSELIKKQTAIQEKIEDAQQREHVDSLRAEQDIVQLVSFLLDEVEYGVDILKVHEILRLSAITRLPNTISYIKGVINLRGNVLPVVDVRGRFGLGSAPNTDLSRIIVVEIGGKLVGLQVDDVHQVIRLPLNHIDPPSRLIEGISEEFIQGIGRLSDSLVILLRLENMLFSEEKTVAS